MILPAGAPIASLSVALVNGDGGLQMPPTGPLSDEEIGILRAWIDQGADFRIQVQEEAPAKPVDPKSPRSFQRFAPRIRRQSKSSLRLIPNWSNRTTEPAQRLFIMPPASARWPP